MVSLLHIINRHQFLNGRKDDGERCLEFMGDIHKELQFHLMVLLILLLLHITYVYLVLHLQFVHIHIEQDKNESQYNNKVDDFGSSRQPPRGKDGYRQMFHLLAPCHTTVRRCLQFEYVLAVIQI